jgi:hypothetical protein
MAADANPIIAFMQEHWVHDDKAKPGPLAAQIYATFEMWCDKHGRTKLLESIPREQELMKAVEHLADFRWLKRVRHTGETKGRYPGLRQRTKKDDQREEQAELAEVEVEIAQVEVKVLKAYRRF